MIIARSWNVVRKLYHIIWKTTRIGDDNVVLFYISRKITSQNFFITIRKIHFSWNFSKTTNKDFLSWQRPFLGIHNCINFRQIKSLNQLFLFLWSQAVHYVLRHYLYEFKKNLIIPSNLLITKLHVMYYSYFNVISLITIVHVFNWTM